MSERRSIYLDNAATSWPKPPVVVDAVVRALTEVGGNPGRAGHARSIAAGRLVDAAREAVAEFFGADDPLRVVFGANVTEALNLALCGLLRPGDHVITSSIEHNSMMRPLRQLESEGVALTVVACAPDGTLDPAQVLAALRPETRLVALCQASNVAGTLLPVAEIGRRLRACTLAQPLLLVDSAASAGIVPIDIERDAIDLLAFTGHKSLLGPTGTGGLILGRRVDPARIRPLKRGGTGSLSEQEEQPRFLPDAFESGTLNVAGLAGLDAGLRWLLAQDRAALRQQHAANTRRLLDGLGAIPGVTLFGPRDPARQVDIVSFTLAGMSCSEAGFRLDEEFGVECRIGLHCAPAAHRTFGTFPEGSIRFAPGLFTATDALDAAIDAAARLASSAHA
ncbi:aminotransferase class V-fold PLP-dependent enzyme [uncultured Propionivibrio sp.]|uniref:aminotransferase class V-fold PLP-dependent enzyme n=1 Tax=uncultured Propionivibrio sp. TaxID=426737 RepID=UPI0029C0D513|nr:aminotransferase class V-fold PLP-dependent enzyme [uncultured Propionivibrio sp.]